MRLPYGRRLACYRFNSWRCPCVVRMRGVWLLSCGRWLVVLYTGRVSWADLDAKIEREHQAKGRAI